MVYEIILKGAVIDPGIDLIHDNPRQALVAFQSMSETFGPDSVMLLRDDRPITAAQLASDIESYEIQAVIEQDTQLPSTYRHGWGRDSDLGFGTDGYAHGVAKPPNPEDNYE